MTRGADAYNAGRRSGGSPAVESRASGADTSMKCAGWKCSFSLALVLGGILLTALPLPARQAPPPAAIISSNLTANLALTAPDPAQTVKEKLPDLEQGVAEHKSHADNASLLGRAPLVLLRPGPR